MNISAQSAVLSPSQLHWWRSSRSDVHVGDALGVIALPPEADLTKLGRAINLVAEHNEILRTAFHVPPGMDRPMPVAEPPEATASLPVVEWNNQAPPGGADAREIIQRHGNGRCLRFAVTMSPGQSVLIVTLPPPCADRRTFSLLAQDIAEAYGDESSYRRAAKDANTGRGCRGLRSTFRQSRRCRNGAPAGLAMDAFRLESTRRSPQPSSP
jgi:hypothetical protein